METMKLIGSRAEQAESEVFSLIATGSIIKQHLDNATVRQALLRRGYENGNRYSEVELQYYHPEMGRFALMLREGGYENTLTILHSNYICSSTISTIVEKNNDCHFDMRTPDAFINMCNKMRLGLESYC